MEKNINANQARTFLLLTAQINSKTSSEIQRKFDAIEISFQNPTESVIFCKRHLQDKCK